jgi:hypothetical protein
MNPQDQRLATLLTYAGTLPLLAAALAQQLRLPEIDAAFIGACYGAVIVAFISGIHWALYMQHGARCPRNLLITSNITALAAWLCLLSPSLTAAFAMLALCFVLLLVLDIGLRDAGLVPAWFFALRRNATAVVVGALALLAVSA